MSRITTTSLGNKFDELREKYANTPEEIEDYEQTVRNVALIRKLLMVIDAERQRAGLSKAELARRIGADASVVRRLFSNKASNPTLRTVLDLLSTLEIDVKLTPKARRRPTAASPKASGRRSIRQVGGAGSS